MKEKPRYCVISMRVTEEEKAQATEQAKKEKVSVDWLLREAAVNRGLFEKGGQKRAQENGQKDGSKY